MHSRGAPSGDGLDPYSQRLCALVFIWMAVPVPLCIMFWLNVFFSAVLINCLYQIPTFQRFADALEYTPKGKGNQNWILMKILVLYEEKCSKMEKNRLPTFTVTG